VGWEEKGLNNFKTFSNSMSQVLGDTYEKFKEKGEIAECL
jgi:hypothetical protein